MLLIPLLASLSFTQTVSAFPFNKGNLNTPMEDMLDVMQQLMTGGEQFDRNFIKKARTCMATFDPQLPDVHDSIWRGIADYWDMGGNPDDLWGNRPSKFHECNVTVSSYKKMTIYEPCNFASNVAYYHLLLELCNRRSVGSEFHLSPEYIIAFGKMFAALPPASSFLHGSNTKLGYQQDVGIVRIIGYLLHQGVMEALPYRSPILNDLSPVPRSLTSLQIVDAVQKMHSSDPVGTWYNTFESLDIPSYLESFAAALYTVVHMNFGDHVANLFVPIIVNSLRLTEEQQQFFQNDFIPELKRATPYMDRKKNFRNNFLANSLGSMAKLIHAFVWHEYRLFNSSIILKPITNLIGSRVFSKVNRKLNGATNYQFYQPDFQRGVNIYPGEQRCNRLIAHPKWHVQSAIMLADLVYLADEMNRLLKPT